MLKKFTLEYWRDGDMFVGRLREVPVVFSGGKTLAELEANVADAYASMREDGEPLGIGVSTKKISLDV